MSSPSVRSSASQRLAIWAALLGVFFGALILLRNEGGSSPDGFRPALLEPSAHEGATTLAFPTETELLSAGPGGSLKRWDLVSGRARSQSLLARGFYRRDTVRLLLDPTGGVCVSTTGSGDTCYGLDLAGRGSAFRLGRVTWAKPASGGRCIYGAEENGACLYAFRPGGPGPYRKIPAGPGWRWTPHAALSPDAQSAVALRKGPAGWELQGTGGAPGRWQQVAALSAPTELQFSVDGKLLGWLESAGGGRTLQVYRAGTWVRERSQDVPGSASSLFRFSPDGRQAAMLEEVGREYRMMAPWPERRRERVWVLRVLSDQGRLAPVETGPIRGHAAQVTDCVWSPRGRRIATLDEDGRIALWNARSGRLERFLEPRG